MVCGFDEGSAGALFFFLCALRGARPPAPSPLALRAEQILRFALDDITFGIVVEMCAVRGPGADRSEDLIPTVVLLDAGRSAAVLDVVRYRRGAWSGGKCDGGAVPWAHPSREAVAGRVLARDGVLCGQWSPTGRSIAR